MNIVLGQPAPRLTDQYLQAGIRTPPHKISALRLSRGHASERHAEEDKNIDPVYGRGDPLPPKHQRTADNGRRLCLPSGYSRPASLGADVALALTVPFAAAF